MILFKKGKIVFQKRDEGYSIMQDPHIHLEIKEDGWFKPKFKTLFATSQPFGIKEPVYFWFDTETKSVVDIKKIM